jgi:hypothetical protein
MHRIVAVPLLGLAALVAGCSGKDTSATAPPAAGKPAAAAAVAIDPGSRLDLDSGRVSVFSPQGWRRAPRSYDYLVRYQSTPQLPYPAVVVIAADPPEGFAELTGDNHAAFVEAIAAQLAERENESILRKPARAQVGPHHAVSWAASGESNLDGTTNKIERDCTAVVIAGRLYTVEAWALRGKLAEAGRVAAKAVAAALTVPALAPAEPLAPFVPPTEPTPEPTPPAAAAGRHPAWQAASPRLAPGGL